MLRNTPGAGHAAGRRRSRPGRALIPLSPSPCCVGWGHENRADSASIAPTTARERVPSPSASPSWPGGPGLRGLHDRLPGALKCPPWSSALPCWPATARDRCAGASCCTRCSSARHLPPRRRPADPATWPARKASAAGQAVFDLFKGVLALFLLKWAWCRRPGGGPARPLGRS